MTRGGRRAQRGDGVLDATLIKHQYVGVSLDNERRAFPTYGLGDLGEAVEEVPLVEYLRLGRVEVLGLGIAERPGPKTHDPAAPIRYRESDPASETLPTSRR